MKPKKLIEIMESLRNHLAEDPERKHAEIEAFKANLQKPQHTPTRCELCKWVHEADSIKQTSFMGVQFCPLHERAVNSYEKLVLALLHAHEAIDELAPEGHDGADYCNCETALAYRWAKRVK